MEYSKSRITKVNLHSPQGVVKSGVSVSLHIKKNGPICDSFPAFSPHSPPSVRRLPAPIILKCADCRTRRPNVWVPHQTVEDRTESATSHELLRMPECFRCRRLEPSHLVLLVHFDPTLEKKLHCFLVFACYCVVKSSPVMLRPPPGPKKKFENPQWPVFAPRWIEKTYHILCIGIQPSSKSLHCLHIVPLSCIYKQLLCFQHYTTQRTQQTYT